MDQRNLFFSRQVKLPQMAVCENEKYFNDAIDSYRNNLP